MTDERGNCEMCHDFAQFVADTQALHDQQTGKYDAWHRAQYAHLLGDTRDLWSRHRVEQHGIRPWEPPPPDPARMAEHVWWNTQPCARKVLEASGVVKPFLETTP